MEEYVRDPSEGSQDGKVFVACCFFIYLFNASFFLVIHDDGSPIARRFDSSDFHDLSCIHLVAVLRVQQERRGVRPMGGVLFEISKKKIRKMRTIGRGGLFLSHDHHCKEMTFLGLGRRNDVVVCVVTCFVRDTLSILLASFFLVLYLGSEAKRC